jgi:acetylornithine deacetylase/succinyl-diaminopimelate desuccinylase-like protein
MTIKEYISKNQNEIVKELADFVRIPSVSAKGEHLDEAAQYIKQIMERVGIKTRMISTSSYPVVYGEISCGNKEKPTVLVYGHYDVQPAEPLEKWNTPPFEPTIIDGVMYGRGSTDNKGYNIAYIRAVDALLKREGVLPCNLKFVFEGCEESGSRGLEQFFSENKELLQAEYTVSTDGPRHDCGRPWLTLGCKGLLYLEMTLKTMERDAHSANASVLPSAAWEMVHLLKKLVDEDGNILVPHFFDGALEMTELERKIMSAVPPTEESTKAIYKPTKVLAKEGMTFEEKLIFTPTFNISGMYSGYTGKDAKTVLTSEATVKLDFRLLPNQDGEQVMQCIKDYISQLGYDNVEVKKLSYIKPSKTPMNLRGVRIAQEACKKVFGVDPVTTPIVPATGPVYMFTDVLGQPLVFFRYSDADCNNHAPNEKMTLDLLFKGIEFMAEVYEMSGQVAEQ